MAVRKIERLFPKPDAYATADTVNLAGGKAFTHSVDERCLRLLMTGTFEDTYYAEAKTLAAEALVVFEQMAKGDPELLAKMIVYARNEGLLRTVPITALVILSKYQPGLMRTIFKRVIRTPNDLRDFVTLVKQGSLRPGMGRAVKAAVNDWLNGMSEYHAIKYGSSGNDFSLRDIMRLTHPKPEGEKNEVLFNYLVNGYDENKAVYTHSLIPQVSYFEALKRTKDPDEQRAMILQGRLPYEVVVGAIKPDTDTWVELMKQMPYFALLRHLNTLNKHGVFNNSKNVSYVCGILTDPKRVANSRVLPFRFFTAFNTLDDSMPRAIFEAVEVALELSFDNLPQFEQRIAVGSDVSGSMNSQISGKGKTRYIDICAIFTAAILRKSREAIVLPFETHVHTETRFSARDTLMTTARTLSRIGGGGTAVGAPAAHLLQTNQKIDVFIGITDCEDWAPAHGYYGRQGFTNIWQDYRKKVNPEAQAYLLTISPYSTHMSKQGEPGIHYIYGWSDSVPEYISRELSGQGTQMAEVKAINLHDTNVSVGESTIE